MAVRRYEARWLYVDATISLRVNLNSMTPLAADAFVARLGATLEMFADNKKARAGARWLIAAALESDGLSGHPYGSSGPGSRIFISRLMKWILDRRI